MFFVQINFPLTKLATKAITGIKSENGWYIFIQGISQGAFQGNVVSLLPGAESFLDGFLSWWSAQKIS